MPADDIDFGPNVGLVEEIYRQWLEDPNSVAESWQDFFADYKPRLPAKSGNGETAVEEPLHAPRSSEARIFTAPRFRGRCPCPCCCSCCCSSGSRS